MGQYTLKITDVTNNHTYNLTFPGTKTILEVKNDVYSITDIMLRHQIWTGWPPNIDDNTILGLSGINYPEHELTVEKKESKEETSNTSTNTTTPTASQIVNMESDDEEFEDASENFGMDDYFIDNVSSKRIEPLSIIFVH